MAGHYVNLSSIADLLRFRELDLGQYIFTKSLKKGAAKPKKPAWLYRSYPADELA